MFVDESYETMVICEWILWMPIGSVYAVKRCVCDENIPKNNKKFLVRGAGM